MKKNRKKTETYRFNGLWGMKPVRIDELKALIVRFEAKLADPDDVDDKKWTARWLERFRNELAKKEKNLEQQ
jgi:hypothetical protein